jgi:hypothetical protein
MIPGIPRRGFVKTLVLGLGAVGFAGWVCLFVRRPRFAHLPPLAEKLVGVLVHEQSANVVGRAYLAQRPAEADPFILVDLICGRDPDSPLTFGPADRQTVGQWLQRRQQEDFEFGRIVKLDGWILSETEGRLCALAALV